MALLSALSALASLLMLSSFIYTVYLAYCGIVTTLVIAPLRFFDIKGFKQYGWCSGKLISIYMYLGDEFLIKLTFYFFYDRFIFFSFSSYSLISKS